MRVNIWVAIFIVAIASLFSAQYAIYETTERLQNVCEECELAKQAYDRTEKACNGQVEKYKQQKNGYEKFKVALDEWIEECK